MKTMNLMAALALVAAAHSISTRTASARETVAQQQPQAERIFDLPTVRVYATVERERAPAMARAQAELRVHDLPAVRVHAPREASIDRRQVSATRSASRRQALGIPRGGQRRGITPERIPGASVEERGESWVALGCMIRLRLSRVWPTQGCNANAAMDGHRLPRANAGMTAASLGRRR
ncbi:hypothetical protein QLQ15_16745 [Lysobacter sp. LF1]|uniref:Uncharacterized protein n=1 Tax=Lysobacter stagni TaxID=3045172 RepID=A0ABT6XK59_9GAMM|nr:hypothetical protein [Lysobacter sp. LF1]MDI9240554.1 hypothetical protein [Lysobacter sp. LF1]